MQEKVQEKIEIHYYFNDNSHKMDAFVRNKAEKDLLDALLRVGDLYDVELSIETEAFEEGGLKEFLISSFVGTALYLQPTINDTFTYYLTKDDDIHELQKEKLKKEIESISLDNEVKQLKIEKILEDKKLKRHTSNFYKKLKDYPKIEKIGFKSLTNQKIEYSIDKKDFKKFILLDEVDIMEDDNAVIEIISPILTEGKFKWRGIYKGSAIIFSMGDSGFKEEVIKGKQSFISGTMIFCNLQIKIIYDEFGEEKRKSFSVKQVYGKQETPTDEMRLRTSGVKKKRKDNEHRNQSQLFDFIE